MVQQFSTRRLPCDSGHSSMSTSRRSEFVKGTLLPFPAFALVSLLVWFLFYTGSGPSELGLDLLLLAAGGVTVGIVVLVARCWNRSRWRAIGIAASFFVFVLLAGAFALFLLAAIGSAIKG
jgi:hypothetical protein